MPTLYALLVAINDYPRPRHRLTGCINDLQALETYLRQHFGDAGMSVRFHILTNQQATRDKIIAGFDHFCEARDGDCCLFFFAGHGSRCAAPEAFWHLEPDRMHESLVCYDSREPGGRDLMDKELSFLIWRVSQDRNIHFLLITDCCHSGAVTRMQGEVRCRRVENVHQTIPASDYHGFPFYKRDSVDRYSPPRGRYVHLSACRKDQTAHEVEIGDESHGAFSYALLETLRSLRGRIPYADLINRTSIRIRTKIADQSPQIEATEPLDKNLFFLSGESGRQLGEYVLSYDAALGWIVHIGALHGITLEEEAGQGLFRLMDDNRKLSVQRLLPVCTLVKGADGLDYRKIYKVSLVRPAKQPLILAFSDDSEEEGTRLVREIYSREKSTLLSFGPHDQARYLLHAKKDTFSITPPFSERPLLRKIKGYTPAAAKVLLANLEIMGNWLHTLELCHPASQIQDGEIQIELAQVTAAGNYQDDAPVQWEDWRMPAEFPYRLQKGKWHFPAFQCKLSNRGQRKLWLSLLYLAEDYSVTNQLLPIQVLNPGEAIWVLDIFEGHSYRTIPVKMDKESISRGMTSVEEYLKLIISTEEFSTDHLNQQAVDLSGQMTLTRTAGREQADMILQNDWSTKEITLRIHRPIPPVTVDAGNPGFLFGHRLELPPPCSANLALTTLAKATALFDNPLEPELDSGDRFIAFDLGLPEDLPGLSVIEIMDFQDKGAVLRQPVKIQLARVEDVQPSIHLFHAHPQTGRLTPISYERIGRDLFLLYHLPESTPSIYGESIKLMVGYIVGGGQ